MDAPCQINANHQQNFFTFTLVYQTKPHTATSVEAMDNESMSDQVGMTPSGPPPDTAIIMPSVPLQHHVQLALVGWARRLSHTSPARQHTTRICYSKHK
jgi:hypothetical protein